MGKAEVMEIEILQFLSMRPWLVCYYPALSVGRADGNLGVEEAGGASC